MNLFPSFVRLLTCGTRKVVQRGPNDFRVVCATCDGGGTVKHATRESASRAAIRDSAKSCKCGAS